MISYRFDAWPCWHSRCSLQNRDAPLSFDYNSLEYVGRIILPYTSTLGQNGSIVETATEWLTT